MNPRRVHELMSKYFPVFDAVSLDWQNVMDSDGLKPGVLTALLRANIPAEEMLIEVHRKVGDFLPLEKAATFIGAHIGQGQIKVADRDFRGCVVIAMNGVAAALPVTPNIRLNSDSSAAS